MLVLTYTLYPQFISQGGTSGVKSGIALLYPLALTSLEPSPRFTPPAFISPPPPECLPNSLSISQYGHGRLPRTLGRQSLAPSSLIRPVAEASYHANRNRPFQALARLRTTTPYLRGPTTTAAAAAAVVVSVVQYLTPRGKPELAIVRPGLVRQLGGEPQLDTPELRVQY